MGVIASEVHCSSGLHSPLPPDYETSSDIALRSCLYMYTNCLTDGEQAISSLTLYSMFLLQGYK